MDTNKITEAISAYQDGKKPYKALIGLDGFVDEIMQVVDIRHDAENFTRIKTLAEYGERISRAAGLSTNIEFVGITRKLGGNGPNMAKALLEQGMDVTYIGALGEESIHPVFQEMGEKCELISLADPGLSFNIEFDDGKLIQSRLDSMKNITWDALKNKCGLAEFADKIGNKELDLFGLENWVMIPYMSDIFRGIIDEAFPLFQPTNCIAFFDLCDSDKRLKADIAEALGLIKGFSNRYRVALGANLKEATQIAAALDLDIIPESGRIDDTDLEEITVKTGKTLGLDYFIVHTLRDSGAWAEGRFHHAPGYYTSETKLTTGGGDNFNAGLCLGLLLGLPVSQSLLLGNASSGFYVREARSAKLSELADFVKNTEIVYD